MEDTNSSSIIQANIFGIFACNMSIPVFLAVFETVSVCQLKFWMVEEPTMTDSVLKTI